MANKKITNKKVAEKPVKAEEKKTQVQPKAEQKNVKQTVVKKVEKVETVVVAKPIEIVDKKPATTVKKTASKPAAKPKTKPVVEVKEQPKEAEKPIQVAQNVVEEQPKEVGKKVLFVAAEALPYIKTGGLADVAGALPKALNELGCDVRVILPLYMDIPNKFRENMKFVGFCYVNLSWRCQYCGIFTQDYDGVTYYFIDNEYYFKRHGLYGHYDDGERFAFFSKAVLESLKIIDFCPDIIHCNDWHAALTPVFLDSFYRGMEQCKFAKTVFTIHNIEFQGKYGTELISDVLGLSQHERKLVEMDGCVNFMKGGIEASNKVTTVSDTYAKEILTPFFGYDMQKILLNRRYKLSGIINGIDVEKLDPQTDKSLFENYNLETFDKKVNNKTALQQLLGLPVNPNVPMIGMVGRLTHQKGLDLLDYVIERMLSMNLQLVVLGTGDWKYENRLKELQSRYSGKLRAIINFSSDMASKIYGASDMFLMPSKFEPCGLSQMIAMRYGSIPIVRETGGLKDTVPPYNHTTGEGRGFTFVTYNADDMLYAVERAVGLYYDYKDDWKKVVRNAMTADFSWQSIAKKYKELYDNM